MTNGGKQKLEVVNFDNSSDWFEDETEGQLLLDVYQDQKNIYIKSAIAGVKAEDLRISLNNDMLTIRGERRSEVVNDEAVDYFYQECYWGSFSRSIILPVEVKTDKISATLKNGVLTITLPKTQRRTTIPIEVSQD
ncbi:MAG: Hsp20/alpha crystallin family protein [Candidatus Buchananbacteria bacterium]|nr:Hsp20/alpha crystallin family protein [Candidatus Buchananbacteria bacterium]